MKKHSCCCEELIFVDICSLAQRSNKITNFIINITKEKLCKKAIKKAEKEYHMILIYTLQRDNNCRIILEPKKLGSA